MASLEGDNLVLHLYFTLSVYWTSGLITGAASGGSGLIRGVASLKRDNLVVFYFFSVPDIWSSKMVDFGGSGLIRRMATLEGGNLVVSILLSQCT